MVIVTALSMDGYLCTTPPHPNQSNPIQPEPSHQRNPTWLQSSTKASRHHSRAAEPSGASCSERPTKSWKRLRGSL